MVIKKVKDRKCPYFKPDIEYFDGDYWVYEYPFIPGVTIHTLIMQNDFSWIGLFLAFIHKSVVGYIDDGVLLPFDDICNFGNFVLYNNVIYAIDLIDSKICCYDKSDFFEMCDKLINYNQLYKIRYQYVIEEKHECQ